MLIHKNPLLMSGMMGLMLPWMIHMENSGGAGLAFVFAHVAFGVCLLALALFVPRVRRRLATSKSHRSHMSFLPVMGLGLIAGWGATCVYCLAIGGVHWT